MNEKKAGVIGLGRIGGGVAVSLTKSGRIPVCYDVVEDAYAKWAPHLTGQAKSLKELGDCDVVMIAVFDAKQCMSVLEGEEGLLANMKPGSAIVILSTVGIDDIKNMYRMCKEKGIYLLDSGVSPGQLSDQNGLIALTGGDDEGIEMAMPVLQDWAKEVIHCGGSGAGMAAKLARNMITFDSWRVTTEAARMAVKMGVKPQALVDGLLACDRQQPDLYYNLIIKRASDENFNLSPGASSYLIPYMQKDLKSALEAAKAVGAAAPVTEQVLELVEDTVSNL